MNVENVDPEVLSLAKQCLMAQLKPLEDELFRLRGQELIIETEVKEKRGLVVAINLELERQANQGEEAASAAESKTPLPEATAPKKRKKLSPEHKEKIGATTALRFAIERSDGRNTKAVKDARRRLADADLALEKSKDPRTW